MAPILIGASLIQFATYALYNWYFHPFKVLVETKIKPLDDMEMQPLFTTMNESSFRGQVKPYHRWTYPTLIHPDDQNGPSNQKTPNIQSHQKFGSFADFKS